MPIGTTRVDNRIGPECNDAVFAAAGAQLIGKTTRGAKFAEMNIGKSIHLLSKSQIGFDQALQGIAVISGHVLQCGPDLHNNVPLFLLIFVHF